MKTKQIIFCLLHIKIIRLLLMLDTASWAINMQLPREGLKIGGVGRLYTNFLER
jgi:hypothetical protein